MKGKTFFLAIAMGSIGSLFMGCNTDNSVDCPENFTGALEANEQQLTGRWELAAIMADEPVDLTDDDIDNPSQDIYLQYSECLRDGVYEFDADRNFTFEQGQNADSCSNRSSTGGTWQLNAGVLTLVGPCNQQFFGLQLNADADIFSFSEDFSVTDISGIAVPVEITFSYAKNP